MASNGIQYQLPKLTGKNYNQWSIMMKTLFGSQELWETVEQGFTEPDDVDSLNQQQLTTLRENRKKDKKALYFIYQAVDEPIFERISDAATSKAAWDTLNVAYKGEEKVKMVRLQALRGEFEMLRMKEGESAEDYFNKVISVSNQLKVNGEEVSNQKIVEKVLRSMTRSYEHIVVAIEESKDMSTLSPEALLGSLKSHELRIKQSHSTPSDQALQTHTQEFGRNSFQGGGRGGFQGRGSQGRGRGNFQGSSQGQGRGRGFGRSSGRGGRGYSQSQSQVQCHYCHKFGHFKKDCFKRQRDEKGESRFAHVNHDKGGGDSVFLACKEQEDCASNIWYIDSGCSNHMTGDKSRFVNFDDSMNREVKTGGGKMLQIQGYGDIPIQTKKGMNYMSNVYYVPGLQHNLLSVGQMMRKGHIVSFKDDVCVIKDKYGGLIARIKMTANKMFPLEIKDCPVPCFSGIVNDKSWLWHLRYNHLSFDALTKMCKGHMVRGIPFIDRKEQVCEGCVLGKHHRDSFPHGKATRARQPLELVHLDLCGPMRVASLCGSRYFLTFIDDFSRKVWIYFLKEKSEVFENFKNFKVMVEKESGFYLKTLRTDRGGEYMSGEFEDFLKKNGVRHQLTTRYTPQQNGVAERKNRTIMELVRSCLKTKSMPYIFWAEAVATTGYILNRAPTKSVEGKTPQEAWSGFKPCVSHLRIFGCVAYSHVPDQRRGKLDDKSEKCIFIGYSECSKAYKLYNPNTKKVIISRDVIFNEEASWDWSNGIKSNEVTNIGDLLDSPDDIFGGPEGSNPSGGIPPEGNHTPVASVSSGASAPMGNTSSEDSSDSPPPKMRSMADLYNSTRRILEDDFADFALLAGCDPVVYEEAVKEEKWRIAMNQEMDSIKKNQTWELVDPPEDKKAIGVKWVYKTKVNAQGEIEKHKARLVVKGYKQKYGVDYQDVFAPVARLETIRTVIALAAQNSWRMYQMDVKSAFLNGVLEEEVYVEQPSGYVKKGEEHKVCRLKKALYGLKQAPRAWYSRIDSYFLKSGFKKCPFEHTLYIKQGTGGSILIITLYVDDLIITGNSTKDIEEFKKNMMSEFEMTDLGLLHFFLGMEIKQTKGGIFLSQQKYARDLIDKFRMNDAKPIDNPVESGLKLSKEDKSGSVDPTLFRSLVGSLMYLTATRPDIVYAVSLISRYMESPKKSHWYAGKRILRYILGTLDEGLLYQKVENPKLVGFCDSDWAGDEDDSKSTSGNVFFIGTSPISWMSKKQKVVALSTAEAEYVSLALAGCQALWISWVLEELMHKSEDVPQIFCDNKSAIALGRNPVFHGRSKHIRIKYHFIRELIGNGEIVVNHCKSEDQVADIFTKSLRNDVFRKLKEKLSMVKV